LRSDNSSLFIMLIANASVYFVAECLSRSTSTLFLLDLNGFATGNFLPTSAA
jgi:hypothetical protein